MQQLINEDINPILVLNKFKKYKKNAFVREMDNIVQFISFSVRKYDLRVYAFILPIFVPTDSVYNYGIELTGTDGMDLLSGKYFTTFCEVEDNIEVQFYKYQNKHKPNFCKLVRNLEEGVLPEMDRINSLDKLIFTIENDNEKLFGRRYGKGRHICDFDFYIAAVYKCLCGEYCEGKKNLLQVKYDYEKSGVLEEYEVSRNEYRNIECLLSALAEINDETEKNFRFQYNRICDERRKKYKLIK